MWTTFRLLTFFTFLHFIITFAGYLNAAILKYTFSSPDSGNPSISELHNDLRARLGAYSGIDFDARFNDVMASTLIYSWYDCIRSLIITDEIPGLASLDGDGPLGNRIQNIPLLKHWLMVDMLIRDSIVAENDTFVEYIHYVYYLSQNYNNLLPQDVIKDQFIALKNAITFDRCHGTFTLILRAIKKNLNSEMISELFLHAFYKLAHTDDERLVPHNFEMIELLLTELNPAEFLKCIKEEFEESDLQHEDSFELVSWVVLLPIYAAFKWIDGPYDGFDFLQYQVPLSIDQDKVMRLLDCFIARTRLCHVFLDVKAYRRRQQICFKVIELLKPSNPSLRPAVLEELMTKALHLKLNALLEAILLFDVDSCSDFESQKYLIKSAISACKPINIEAVLILASYREISGKDFRDACFEGGQLNYIISKSGYKTVSQYLALMEETFFPEEDLGQSSEEVIETDSIGRRFKIHHFPPPSKKVFDSIPDRVLQCSHECSRMFLARIFAIPFTSTKMKRFYEVPCWREVVDLINFHLKEEKDPQGLHHVVLDGTDKDHWRYNNLEQSLPSAPVNHSHQEQSLPSAVPNK